MLKIFILTSLVSISAFAGDCTTTEKVEAPNILRQLASTAESPKDTKSSSSQDAERSGCCSHHRGVCGCSFGRAVCCDGSYSPTCGCD